MVLADLGADVVRVDRPSVGRRPRGGPVRHPRPGPPVGGRRPEGAGRTRGRAAARRAGRRAARGVPPRRGRAPRHRAGAVPGSQPAPRLRAHDRLGPGRARSRRSAGHDLTYAAVAGALAHIGRAGQLPTPPLNLVADFGGGGMLLALGLVAGLLHARANGRGPGGRRRDGRRHRAAHGAVLRRPRDGVLVRRARHEPARLRRALLRRVPLRRRRGARRSGPSSRSSSPPCSRSSSLAPGVAARPERPGAVAGAASRPRPGRSTGGRAPSGSRGPRAPTPASRRC